MYLHRQIKWKNIHIQSMQFLWHQRTRHTQTQLAVKRERVGWQDSRIQNRNKVNVCIAPSLDATTVAKPSTDIVFHGKGANVPSQHKEEKTCTAPSFPVFLLQKRRRRPSHPLARVSFQEWFGKHPIGSVHLYSLF